MIEGLAWVQNYFAVNYGLVLGTVFHCPVAVPMRWFSLALVGMWLVRWLTAAYLDHVRRSVAKPLCGKSYPLVHAAYQRARRHAGLDRAPPLFHGDRSGVPAYTSGLFRPAVFLNVNLGAALDSDELEALLTHELMHVKRRDNLRVWALDLCFTTVPLWPVLLFGAFFIRNNVFTLTLVAITMPLVLLARTVILKRFRQKRELVCDALTARHTGNGPALAASLIKARQFIGTDSSPSLSHGVNGLHTFIGRGCLERRVKRLLAPLPAHGWLRRVLVGMRWLFLVGALLFLFRFHVTGSYEPMLARCREAAACMIQR